MILDLFRNEVEFKNIQGYDDIKHLVRRALEAKDNYNLLFVGPPASAKSLFLLGILESKKGVYFDGSNTTNRILDVLEEKRPMIICIDELDKMGRQFQEKLLNFMESGHVKVDQMAKLHAENRYDRLTSDVQKLTGKPSMSLREYVIAHPEVFSIAAVTR
jgi:hypothetical protein